MAARGPRRPSPSTTAGRPEPGPFALTLEITPPTGWRGSLITLLKPLADGVVSALHSHDGPLEAVLDRATDNRGRP